MYRIALIQISQETNDFNPVPTCISDFEAFGLFHGDDVLAVHEGQIGGFLSEVRDRDDITIVPVIRALATAGGRLDDVAHAYFLEKINQGLHRAGQVDALALHLHGACAADGVDDVEGEQTALCRSILGPDIPIVLSLDHHGVLTEKMVANTNAIVAHRDQPHNPYETGQLAAQLLLPMLEGKTKPVMAWRHIPMLSHQEQFLTSGGPMKQWFDLARAYENEPHVLSASTFPMQPWLDLPDAGWAALVVTDNNSELADELAQNLADSAWNMRHEFQHQTALPVDEALQKAAKTEGLVILSDTGDTVFGGTAGDGTILLKALLNTDFGGKALVPVVSPKAARQLCNAGTGATLTLDIGGELSGFFAPVEVTGTVRAVGGGPVDIGYDQQPIVDFGKTAIFEAGSVTMLVTENRGVGGNLPSAYSIFGVDPTTYKIAVLKTASNFQYFAPISTAIVRADTPGPGQSDLTTLPWKRLPKSLFPWSEP